MNDCVRGREGKSLNRFGWTAAIVASAPGGARSLAASRDGMSLHFALVVR
jgi:hypothetical protein